MSKLKLDRPLIIWTLQRTGGTNLSRFLNRISEYGKTQDEPLNPLRQFGEISREWKKTKDNDLLNSQMVDMLARSLNIKHCVEQPPYAVTVALAECSLETDYLHLFLYRRNPLNRLLSMEYAKRTEIWGPRKDQKDNDAQVFIEPLNVDALVNHEKRCRFRLNTAWEKLIQQGAAPTAVSFEDIYMTDVETAKRGLKHLLTQLGLNPSSEQLDKIIARLRDRGDQKTSDRYSQFKGIDELAARLDEVPKLIFQMETDA